MLGAQSFREQETWKPDATLQARVVELQSMLQSGDAPLHVDMFTCQRFLKANDGHVRKAAKQYRKFIAWRAAERIDEVLSEPPHEEAVEYELRRVSMRLLEGYDLKERPVMVAALGKVDITELKKKGVTLQMMVRRHARAMEQLVKRVEEAPNPHAGHLLMFDLAGCTLSKFFWAWTYIREVAHMGQAYYPEVLGKLCFVRGPEKVRVLLLLLWAPPHPSLFFVRGPNFHSTPCPSPHTALTQLLTSPFVQPLAQPLTQPLLPPRPFDRTPCVERPHAWSVHSTPSARGLPPPVHLPTALCSRRRSSLSAPCLVSLSQAVWAVDKVKLILNPSTREKVCEGHAMTAPMTTPPQRRPRPPTPPPSPLLLRLHGRPRSRHLARDIACCAPEPSPPAALTTALRRAEHMQVELSAGNVLPLLRAHLPLTTALPDGESLGLPLLILPWPPSPPHPPLASLSSSSSLEQT